MWTNLFNLYLSKRPFEGYGFNAFWYIDAHRETMHIVAGYPDQIVISDNGFIDLLINTGYIGLTLFLIFFVGLGWHSFQHARKAQDIDDLFPIFLVIFTILANVSWSLIFENEGFFMLLMIAALFSMTHNRAKLLATLQ